VCWSCCDNQVFELSDYLPAQVCDRCYGTIAPGGADGGVDDAPAPTADVAGGNPASATPSLPRHDSRVEYKYAAQGRGMPMAFEITIAQVDVTLAGIASPVCRLAARRFAFGTTRTADDRSSISVRAHSLDLEDIRPSVAHRPRRHRCLLQPRCHGDAERGGSSGTNGGGVDRELQHGVQVSYTARRQAVGSEEYVLRISDSILTVVPDTIVAIGACFGLGASVNSDDLGGQGDGEPLGEEGDSVLAAPHTTRRESAFVSHPSKRFATVLEHTLVLVVHQPDIVTSAVALVHANLTAVSHQVRDHQLRTNRLLAGSAEELHVGIVWSHLPTPPAAQPAPSPTSRGAHRASPTSMYVARVAIPRALQLAGWGSPSLAHDRVLQPVTVSWRMTEKHVEDTAGSRGRGGVSGDAVGNAANAERGRETSELAAPRVVVQRVTQVQASAIGAAAGFSHVTVLGDVAGGLSAAVTQLTATAPATSPRTQSPSVEHRPSTSFPVYDTVSLRCPEVSGIALDDAVATACVPVVAAFVSDIAVGILRRASTTSLTAEFAVIAQR